ncbi:J domain-containing protein [Saccharomonospora marina]|nr:J domain-containing protein [Saccharomonospora marina]
MTMSPSPVPDPYEVLGVSWEATPSEIAAAYRALVRHLHPDAAHAPADPARLTEVLAAYAELRDPRRRATDDRDRPAPPPGREPISIPVRVHRRGARSQPDLRVGPVRRHLH